MKQLAISSFASIRAINYSVFLLFFMILGSEIGWAQGGFASCGTSANNPFPILPVPSATSCYPITQHPIFVRIKAHILRPSNGLSELGQSPETVKRAIARMQANFAPFMIYFLWDACEINYIDNDDVYSSKLSETLNNLRIEYGSGIDEPNKIDIFFYPNDYITDELGSTLHITSDVIGLGGISTNLIPTIETNLLSHEMAHCLGLYHSNQTNITSTGSILCACEVYASLVIDECCACGDLVCDTPFYPDDISSIESNCNWQETATLPNCDFVFSDPATNNFMSNINKVCAKRFTQGQGIRMRHVLTQDPLNVTQSDNGTHLFTNLNIPSVNTPSIWATGMFPNNQVIIYEDLTIESGYSLEIKEGVSVLFARSAKLIVKPNAMLKLSGTLTSMCGDYWQGVKVYGLPGQTNQYPKNGVYAQGRIESDANGIIENAITGVELYGGDGSGGQINSKGTLFRNNQIGVAFQRYVNNIPPYPHTPGALLTAGNQNYKARFNACVFETNDNYPKTLMENKYFFYAFMDMTEVKGVQIFSCSFTNSKEELCSNSSNTTCKGYGIHAISSGFTINHAYGSNVDGTFKGLEEAIAVSNPPMTSALNRPVTIRSASFIDNYVGIYLENILGASITGNKFYLGNMPGNPSEKVQFGTTFALSSEFVYTGNQFHKVDGNAAITVGTCNYDIGSANNTISQNQYSKIHIANVSNGMNSEQPNNINSGLYYECNTNEGVTAYDFVMPNATDRIRTNQGKFVGFDPSNNAPVYRPAGNRFSHQGTCNFSDFYQSLQNINYYYAHPMLTGDSFQVPLYHNLNTTNLFPVKTMATCSDIGFENILRTKEELNHIRKEYCSATNNFVQARNNWINAIKSGNKTQIEKTERVAGLHRHTMYELAKKGFLHALHDTIHYSEDSIRAWQSRLWTYESDVRLALSYGFAGQSAEAAQVIRQIPQRYALAAAQKAELSHLPTLIDIGTNKISQKLDKSTESILLQIAQGSYDGIAAQTSKGILSNYSYIFPPFSCSLPECLAGKTQLRYNDSGQKVPEPLEIAVTPNPANDHILVQISKIGDRSGQFKMVGLWGQAVFQATVQGNLSVQVNAGSLPAGIYIWVLTLSDGTISQGRIIVQH